MMGSESGFAPIHSFSGHPMQLRDSSQCVAQNSLQFPPTSPSSFSSPSFPFCVSSILSQQFLSLQLLSEELEQRQKNLLEAFEMRRAVRSQEALIRSRTCQERLQQLSNRQREAKEKLQRQQQKAYQYQKDCLSQNRTGEVFGTLMTMTPADLLNVQKAKLQKLVEQTAPLFWSHYHHHFRHTLPAPLVSSDEKIALSPRHRLPYTQQQQNSSLKHSHESNDTPKGGETGRSSVPQKQVTFYIDGCEKPEITSGKPREILVIDTETAARDPDQERYTTHRVAKVPCSDSKPMTDFANSLDAVKTSSLKLLDIEAEKEKSTKSSAVEPVESISASYKIPITHREEYSTWKETIINKAETILPNDAVPQQQVLLTSCNPPPSSTNATPDGYNNNVNENNITQSLSSSYETPKADSLTRFFISPTSTNEDDEHALSCVHSVKPLCSKANLTVSHLLRRQQSHHSHSRRDSKSCCKTTKNAKPSRRLCSFTSFALGKTSNGTFHGQEEEGTKFLPAQRNCSPQNRSIIIPLVSESSSRALSTPQLSTSAPSSPTHRTPFLTYSHRILHPQSTSSLSPQQPITASLPSPSPPPPDPPPELVPTSSFVVKGFSTPSPACCILPPTLFSPSKSPPLPFSPLKSPAMASPSSPLSPETLCSRKLLPIHSPPKQYLPTISPSPQLFVQTAASTLQPFQQLLPASLPPPCLRLLPTSSSPQKLTPKTTFLPSQEASSDSSFPNQSFTASLPAPQRNLNSSSLQFPINVSTSSYAVPTDPTSPVHPFPSSRMPSSRFSFTQLPPDLSHLSLATLSSPPSRMPTIPSMLTPIVSLPPQAPIAIICRKPSPPLITCFSKKPFIPSNSSSMAAVPNDRTREDDDVLSPSPLPCLGSPSSSSHSYSDSMHNKYFPTSSSLLTPQQLRPLLPINLSTSVERNTTYYGDCSEISELPCVSSSFFGTSSCENLPPLHEIIEGDEIETDEELIDEKYLIAGKKKHKHSWPIY